MKEKHTTLRPHLLSGTQWDKKRVTYYVTIDTALRCYIAGKYKQYLSPACLPCGDRCHDNGLYDVTTLSISDQTKEFKTRTFFSIYLPNFCSCKIENRTKNRLRIIQVFFLAKSDMVTFVVKKKAANYKMLISRTPPTVLILKFLV